jgi:hypothetical protein
MNLDSALLVIVTGLILFVQPTPANPQLTFEQRWEPVKQIPAPRELTFEERWAPVRQLPRMLDVSFMPPPPPENRTAQLDSSLFSPQPILTQEENDNLPNAPVRIIRVKVEHRPVPAFLFDPKPAAPSLMQREAVAPESAPLPNPRPSQGTSRDNTRQVASIRRRPGDICSRHGMHKEVIRGGKSWRCRR